MKPLSLLQGILRDLIGSCRPWAYQAHVANQDIEQLGEFVDAEFADESSHASDPGIFFHFEKHSVFRLVVFQELIFNIVCPNDHGSKLEEPEMPTISSHSCLAVKNRSPAL